MDQELDLDELEQVAGGDCSLSDQEADYYCCVKDHYRSRVMHGCAATVENGSLCSNNDYCINYAVVYHCHHDMYDWETGNVNEKGVSKVFVFKGGKNEQEECYCSA